ncbi:MAG TPA: tRNA 2-thiouridine(34) synthase MnmA [Anaerolineaceae bacterium]|nr:tRNA 2-thiouridine(34) synthase MnmA [Anaerolineaceae bacterium]
MEAPRKVVVGMSGGVDSSVAAALLVEQGYRVTGMMLRLWSEPGKDGQNRCCSPDAMAQARRVAASLGIPFYAVDVQELFHNEVVQHFIDGYLEGITPNPCLICNRQIRWGYLLKYAQAFGADFLATGHYARVRHMVEDMVELYRAVDLHKDQSYVLSRLNQEQLKHSLFPLGELTKPQVRQIARNFGLSVAERPESQDLCFISDGNYRRFLNEYAPESQKIGQIITSEGKILGEHQGLAFYTIGQRKGLGISSPEPFYVIEKRFEEQTLVVGPVSELGKCELIAQDVNWISGMTPEKSFNAQVKIRYKAELASGMVEPGPEEFRVVFEQPLRDITPGQAAVIYQGNQCLGSGIIKE